MVLFEYFLITCVKLLVIGKRLLLSCYKGKVEEQNTTIISGNDLFVFCFSSNYIRPLSTVR